MAPEVGDIAIPKTNRVDIWSLGCILYRMVTGSPLFANRRDAWRYASKASSPPSVVQNRGFSIHCEDFLRDVLQASPGDRPSARGCLKTGWIMWEDLGSEDCIGSDIYKRLSKIELEAPDIDSFSHTVAVHGAPAKTWSIHDSGDWQAITKLPEPIAEEIGVDGTHSREPPAWRLNCKIGTGAFGTVFLEKVRTHGMQSPELWAVKRISRALPNFPSKQSQAEIKNLQVLSKVSFVQTCLLS